MMAWEGSDMGCVCLLTSMLLPCVILQTPHAFLTDDKAAGFPSPVVSQRWILSGY